MKKAVLIFLLLITASLQMSAAFPHLWKPDKTLLNSLPPQTTDSGKGFIGVYLTNGGVDSIAVDGIYDINHSKYDLEGNEHPDFVTLVITTAEETRKYLIAEVIKVETPEPYPMETITLGNSVVVRNSNGPRHVYFNGTFPKKNDTPIVYRWEEMDSIYINMHGDDFAYKAGLDSMKKDSTWAWFETVKVKKKTEPIYIYYGGRNAPAYNKVRITRTQTQSVVNDTKHIAYSGDCGVDSAKRATHPTLKNYYTFVLDHKPAFFAFLTHNPRVPSVKLKSVTLIADHPIAGTFNYDKDGIDLGSVEDPNDTITLYTPFFNDNGWKHTPRYYENAQDSTAAYMVVAPQKDLTNGINLKFIFNVVDTLSLIDTTFVKTFKVNELRPNTFYTFNAEVPDTLFSIVDLGLGDIKYAFRNVMSYFERGPVSFYGGAFAYGESNTKNDYDPGEYRKNMRWGQINNEFTANWDAAYQRWGGCWRLQQTLEADTLFKYCTFEWREYNGVEGVLVTGPSGKRIFLPANDNCQHYWAVNRDYVNGDLYKDVGGGTVYYKIPGIGIDKNRSVPLYIDRTEFYNPGFARGVIEYSNYLKSNTDYDGSLMLLRHKYEEEVTGTDRFAIVGMVRSARPWPSVNTSVQLQETGFVFGTDSATLYFNPDDELHNKVWNEADSLFDKTEWRPVDGNHLMLKAGSKSVGAYAANEQDIRVELKGSFLGFLDKEKKYFVREYFKVWNKVTSTYDIYYASKATQIKGFFPHTGKIRWQVGDETATLNGYIVGVSAEVVGKVGFVVTDSLINENDYSMPTLHNREIWLSDNDGETAIGEVRKDMTFSYTIPKNKLKNDRYYFVRAVFMTENETNGVRDTTCLYAPDDEVRILHPLDTVDYQMGFKQANINVGAQYPEDRDSTYTWNTKAVPSIITDIAGTEYDVVFEKWFGREGWCFTLPTVEQAQAMLDTLTFKTPNDKQRFYKDVKRVTGINDIKGYMPYTATHSWAVSDYANYWTSQRTGSNDQASYVNLLGGVGQMNSTEKLWVRPVLQTNCKTRDDEILFISTDTVGRYFVTDDSTEIRFYGRELGVTPAMKEKYTTITRGFVLHDFKGGTLEDTPCGNMPDATTKENIFNGLYTVPLPKEVRDSMRADKEYWYRAYITVGTETFYGKPKKITPLSISVDSIGWEVHENKATLYSFVDGVDFVKDREHAVVGYVVGDSATIDLDHKETVWYHDMTGKTLNNTRVNSETHVKSPRYEAVMAVPKDTVYWVRAFIIADGVTRYSVARQFGLDYVDLGIKDSKGQTLLWANIDVGSAYAEDNPDYYSIGESATKYSYCEKTYADDTLKYITDSDGNKYYTTSATKWVDLTVPSVHSKNYTVRFRGAEHNKYNCEGPLYWKAYSGTKNDAAYVNWGNDNTKFEDTDKYIENTKYGNLFVEPEQDEWQCLRDQCTWTPEVLFDVPGWRVTGTNGNSIFLPLKGERRGGTKIEESSLVLTTDTAQFHSAGFFHVSDGYQSTDSVKTVSLNYNDKSFFDTPTVNDGWTLTWGEFYEGFQVRPIARYNLRLTKDAEKLRDETLVYLATDTCYYLNYRTAVALQGSYRINWPMASSAYKLGFVVGSTADVTTATALINTEQKLKNNSQYFVVLDHEDNLESDKTYYYRFYLDIGGTIYYGDPYTFHLADQLTGKEDLWSMYGTKAHINGTVQGVLKNEAQSTGFKAGLIISKNRDLKATDSDLVKDFDRTSSLNDYNGSKGGPIQADFTLPEEAVYYFRTYVYYNGTYHYGDVNLFGYELLDLGLPSGKLWASINTGGNSPLNGRSCGPTYDSHGVNSQTNMPYGNNGNGAGGLNDTSHQLWHNVYRQPYSSEAHELIDNCTWELDTIYGCAGMTGTGPSGKKIFIRRNRQYYQHQGNYTDLSINHDYIRIADNSTKPSVGYLSYHSHGCQGVDFERAIWESTHTLPNSGNDEILIRTDDAIVHPNVDYVSFFGSLLGTVQQRWSHNSYNVSDVEYAGFVVGSDTLTTHKGGTGGKYFKYDFPHNDVKKDSIYWYDRQNINLFKVDSTYWVRAYVKIDGNYYYGRSIKFVRQPNIITGDVDWSVGLQTATLHGSVTGFNNDYAVSNSNQDEEIIQDMEQLSKNARVGMIVGYHHDPVAADTLTNEAKIYYVKVNGQAQAVNGSFQLDVDYERDTTYYYRAFIFYNDQYVYGKTGRYGLEFRDLGFNNGMYWASINVGSRYAEDTSSQFAWGETDSRSTFRFDDYIYYFSTTDEEYNNLGNEIKGTQYDVAHKKWNYTWDEAEFGGRGALWSMTSEDDLQMLVDSCEWRDSTSYKYVPNNYGGYYANVDGYKVISKKNGNWIFIAKNTVPAWTISGYHSDRNGPWEHTPLWTSSRAPRERNSLGMQSGTTYRLMKYHYRYHGHYVRPIAKINVKLPSGHKLSLTTERTSWVAGATSSTIYGCILGLNDAVSATYGFVVGSTNEKLKAKDDGGASDVVTYTVATDSKVNGLFNTTITPLDNNRMYYYRVFAKVNGKYYYGDIKDFGIIMVDLGLTSGTKWANVNMGAWRIKDHGDFYGWGETTTKDVFSEVGYKYFDYELQNYRDLSTNISANDTTDVANKFLKGLWRMAGDEEWNELRTECTWTPDTIAHIPGFRVASKKNSNSIFLPSNYYTVDERDANYDYSTNEEGDTNQNHDDEVTHLGYYWSSNRSADYRQAREFNFDVSQKNSQPSIADNARWRGNSIRPVARPFVSGVPFYLRTESTDWRYEKDSVNFYSAVLELPKNYTTGFLIGTSAELTESTKELDIEARPTVDGSCNYVGTIRHNTRNDGVWYYRAYVKDNSGRYYYADSKQFGLVNVDLGVAGLQWANINVDAASPEEMGLNGVLTGKYETGDPAHVEFGGTWRIPNDTEKQLLVDGCDWEQVSSLYGTQVWKVSNKTDASKFIYLTSDDPSEWGYRGVMQSNLTFDDDVKVYLRTDSTNWRAGYSGSDLYATFVGSSNVQTDITERGFILDLSSEKPADGTDPATFAMNPQSEEEQVGNSNFVATMGSLPVGTYYYRAYVKYKNKYYYAENALPVGIEFIDLGLPSGVRWANVNIGSTVASDAGDRYAWGETSTKSTYTYDNYEHKTSVGYNDIGVDISSSVYDVATQKIDGTRMPSLSDIQELIANCTWTKETLNGVEGWRVSSTNGNSIFLPNSKDNNSIVSNIYYWSSTRRDLALIYYLSTTVNGYGSSSGTRTQGFMVRPVTSMITTTDPTNITTTTAQLNGIVNITASFSNARVGFELSRSSSMANAIDCKIKEVNSNGAYSYSAKDLAEGNLYYYRAYVVITPDGGTDTYYYGAVKNFSTKSTESYTPTAVNLGLSVKWADRNVGANLPEIDGNYYAWGDTVTQRNYTVVTYRHATGNNDNARYHYIGDNISATQWDIANRKFKGCWRMPTLAEVNELISNCSWTWASKEGMPGYWIENTATHQNIFMPASGYRDNTDLNDYKVSGRYWASIPETNGQTKNASSLLFNSDSKSAPLFIRHDGLTIRPVYDTNGKLGEQDIFIRTDSISYAADRTSNTLYGTMLGLLSESDGLTQGFVIGTTTDVDLSTTVISGISQTATANGSYNLTLNDDQLKTLTVGDVYYVRAFVSNGTETKYGEAKMMTDYTFFTDSVKWGLGNAGKLYGHVKGVKPASGLEIGFIYSTNKDMSNSKSVVAAFDTENTDVFIGQIDTIKVATYYYQAYTKYDGVTHKGEIKSFGAKAVNLGLSSGVYWVDMNMGSDDEEKAGDGYRWGETAPNQTGSYRVASGFNYIGGTDYDAAHTRLGVKYRLPSIANVEELLNECTWAFDVNGYRITGPNGNSIFLPVGDYWSSQKGSGTTTNATALSADSSNTKTEKLIDRTTLLLLRAIYSPSGVTVDSDGGNAGGGTIGGGIEGNE